MELAIEGTVSDLKFGGYSGSYFVYFYVAGNGNGRVTRPGSVFRMLASGEVVDSWINFGVFGAFYSNYQGTSTNGDWQTNGQTGFFGFRFELENDSPNATVGTMVYGWAEVERLSPTSGRVLQWAYDDSGAGVVPEPGTLSLLALGAASIAPMRRRRSV